MSDGWGRRLAADLDGAFGELVQSTQDRLYSGVLAFTRHPHDAEDIAQETYLRAYRALAGYSRPRLEELAAVPWLWTIALNLCRNRARGRSRRPAPAPLGDAERPGAGGPEAEALAAAERDRWRDRLGALPEPQARAVTLRHVAGLGYAEVAAVLDRPVGTVKADVHRGLARLRTQLEEERP